MQDIKHTIIEYESSHEQIKARIHELGEQIMNCRGCRHDSSLKILSERRNKLYYALWDIEFALHEMREYVCTLDGLEVNAKVG